MPDETNETTQPLILPHQTEAFDRLCAVGRFRLRRYCCDVSFLEVVITSSRRFNLALVEFLSGILSEVRIPDTGEFFCSIDCKWIR